ncbi:MAG: bifunctional DNA-formamidopyrimidine glycosylase/DNA-(apurinic or apyrimidinic site) lyase [Austwickia sp.]|nr:bifunctional DNA-formamidopyrimidine glycosylase/DNA-(apurinic or apyrimidinic site) lyase [Austwickia sp.]
MPELPEVETVRRGLASHVLGRTVARVTLLGHRVARRHPAGPADLADSLTGCRIDAVRRRGKYLWLVMRPPEWPGGASACPFALIIHLGMSGQLLVTSPAAPPGPHLRATIEFSDKTDTELRFVDQRTFGGMAVAELVPAPGQPDGVPETLVHLGADPFEPAYSVAAVVEAMRHRDSAIKRALLDQRLVSGIGNIYADEALWAAKVHGQRSCSALTRPALGRVLAAAAQVMERALEAGGTSFDALYVNVNGASGYFDRSLNAYGQAGRPCARCGTPIRREPFMNRSSYSCPRCQPRPRR